MKVKLTYKITVSRIINTDSLISDGYIYSPEKMKLAEESYIEECPALLNELDFTDAECKITAEEIK